MTLPPRLGILDWGIGGLGVLRALRRRTRRVPVLYLSDSGFTPYGLLSRSALAARVSTLTQQLVAWGATHVVIACNAASTVLDQLESSSERAVPVTGVIAPVLARIPKSLRGTLGVLGGARTIRSGLYLRGLAGPGRRIVQRIAQPLSAHVEAGSTESTRCAQDLERILRPLRSADALLLACTHYPALFQRIQERAPRALLIDPAEALVDQLLSATGLPSGAAGDRILSTGDARRTRSVATRAWGFDPGPCVRVRIPSASVERTPRRPSSVRLL